MEYSSADFQEKHTPILEEIDEAAYEIDADKLTQDVRRKPRSFLRRMP